MKGQIEKILELIWILVPVLIIVGVHGANILSLADSGRTFEAKFSAVEIAGAISVLQAGPDGVMNQYKLPTVDAPDCITIFQTYVETHFGLLGGRAGESEMVERVAFSANIDFGDAGPPITVSCSGGGKSLVMSKENGKVRIG